MNIDGDPLINLTSVTGTQNWVLLRIGEAAALDYWKAECKKTGNLDVMELVRRATVIKDSLTHDLSELCTDTVKMSKKSNSVPSIFQSGIEQSNTCQASFITGIWAHAALLYLSVVVCGWQPANCDVRYHVDQIIQLLTHDGSRSGILRASVWPFCVAGCLAGPNQQARLRSLVEMLLPPRVYGNLRKALDIMERVWHERDTAEAVEQDLSSLFRSDAGLVLLV